MDSRHNLTALEPAKVQAWLQPTPVTYKIHRGVCQLKDGVLAQASVRRKLESVWYPLYKMNVHVLGRRPTMRPAVAQRSVIAHDGSGIRNYHVEVCAMALGIALPQFAAALGHICGTQHRTQAQGRRVVEPWRFIFEGCSGLNFNGRTGTSPAPRVLQCCCVHCIHVCL